MSKGQRNFIASKMFHIYTEFRPLYIDGETLINKNVGKSKLLHMATDVSVRVTPEVKKGLFEKIIQRTAEVKAFEQKLRNVKV